MGALQKLIGNRIKSQRKAAGISQQKLAELTNYHPDMISKFERGVRRVDLEAAFSISESLDCSVEDFRPEQEPFDY